MAGSELTGAAQVPGPGHPGGTGNADLTLVVERSEVCFVISVHTDAFPRGAIRGQLSMPR